MWTCERFARHLRETCEPLASNIYSCEHLRVICESLACDLRVRLASTCEHLRAIVTSCEPPQKTLCGRYLHNRNVFKAKIGYCWPHISILGLWRVNIKRTLKYLMNNSVGPLGWSAGLSTKYRWIILKLVWQLNFVFVVLITVVLRCKVYWVVNS